jgi:CheY-like chemotaxis protein
MNGFNVLVVDDEPAILTLMRAVFERQGYEVTTAASATDAIALLRDRAFDAVVTDLKMETPLAGFEVVAAARNARPQPYIAIVTAFPLTSSEWKASGADALYIKGSDTFRLPELLSSLLKQRPYADRRRVPKHAAS